MTVIEKATGADVPSWLVAVTLKFVVPELAADGVPVKAPVEVLNDAQLGIVPLEIANDVGELLAVTVEPESDWMDWPAASWKLVGVLVIVGTGTVSVAALELTLVTLLVATARN